MSRIPAEKERKKKKKVLAFIGVLFAFSVSLYPGRYTVLFPSLPFLSTLPCFPSLVSVYGWPRSFSFFFSSLFFFCGSGANVG